MHKIVGDLKLEFLNSIIIKLMEYMPNRKWFLAHLSLGV